MSDKKKFIALTRSQLDELASVFWSRVRFAPGDGCWLWTGPIFKMTGYGRLRGSYIDLLAHRFSFMFAKGPIPDGLELDHLCRVLLCVRPSHLEPVTTRVNQLRSLGQGGLNARKTHCKRGHDLSPNSPSVRINACGRSPRRECLLCVRIRRRVSRERAREDRRIQK